jgi:hypothetical protein
VADELHVDARLLVERFLNGKITSTRSTYVFIVSIRPVAMPQLRAHVIDDGYSKTAERGHAT